MRYQISYDLNKEKNYDKLYERIKSYGEYRNILRSTWLVSTSESAQQIHEKLRPLIDSDDRLFISEVTSNFQGWLPKSDGDWINSH
jgi:hypothetical protein